MQGVPALFESTKDQAQFCSLPEHPTIELYRAHIEKHAFEPHMHEGFGIGTVIRGAECFRYRGSNYVASTDSIVLMSPDELHTGHAATNEGWCYQMIYLDPATLEQITGLLRLQYHVTPQQMLMAFRLFKAKQLLACGMKPAAVAAETGLTDQPHLTRAFSCRYGTTPARYQKMICR